MAHEKRTARLFSLGPNIEGVPKLVEPATFAGLGAKELQHLEEWLKKEPALLGEEVLVIAAQLSSWDKTKDRPDLLCLDRQGKLVVVEIKRDKSGSSQDLQAIRYASYASTLTSDQVCSFYREYRLKEADETISEAEARTAIDAFITDGELDDLDDDDQPRIILVAAGFTPGVTSTALWLLRSWEMDISCIEIEPYELKGEVILSSTTLIPLPEAADYEIRVQAKKRTAKKKAGTPLDLEAVKVFVASIPEGRWASYGDVAAAAGSPKAGQAVGTWLSNHGDSLPTVYRVLDRNGKASGGWKTENPDLPPTPEAVQAKLIEEGISFEDDRASQQQRWNPEDWAEVNDLDA